MLLIITVIYKGEFKMKTQIINKEGLIWEFNTYTEAKPHIKTKRRKEYRIEKKDNELIKIYDDREISI